MLLSFALSFLLMPFVNAATSASSNNAPQDRPKEDAIMKCIYQPAADQQTSSLPTVAMGFKFTLQRNVSGGVAVDLYSLNEQLQPLKQIGHADLISSVLASLSSTINSTSSSAVAGSSSAPSIASLVSSLTIAEDSAFDFNIAVGSDASPTAANARFTATIDAQTFIGQTYSALGVQCRMAPAPGQQGKVESSTVTQ
ncbi:hypothetical protein DOE51_05435 [Bdellovibrio sp. NC01]|nr:hypothetical protein DOE51_05435 [Bdellovibrio sp. NC01]